MSRNTKIVLAIIGGIVLVCLCVAVGGLLMLRNLGDELVIDNPAEISAAASDIADYNLPPGYEEQGLVNFIFGKILMISAGDITGATSRPVIIFIQLPEEMLSGEEDLRAQSELGIQQALGRGDFNLEYVGERNAIIRGENVALLTYEGVDGEGEPFRQVISEVFSGKAGPTILVVIGPIRGWDQSDVDSFVRSLR